MVKNALVFLLGLAAAIPVHAQAVEAKATQPFVFAVSGDSRNCGDIVMPTIAKAAQKDGAKFYLHLGDIRWMSGIDQDIAKRATGPKPGSIAEYRNMAWDDAIQNQFETFGTTPVYVGIGNHEVVAPKTRQQFITRYSKWLDSPVLRQQRLRDNPKDTSPNAYFHWKQAGVDFIYLDNATHDQFDAAQLEWLDGILASARKDASIKSVVVGMHAILPDSLAAGHSMNDWSIGTESGRKVYRDLLLFRKETKKNVYLLASHSHFYMSNVFNSAYWKSNGGVLPGWITGTAGAHRYPLPDTKDQATEARTNVYGYLIGTVKSDGTIAFQFHEVKESDVPAPVVTKFGKSLVHECWKYNTDVPQ